MPEGPELAYSRDKLRLLLLDRRMVNFLTTHKGRYARQSPKGMIDFLADCSKSKPSVDAVETKGKFMWWRFRFDDGASWYMHNTYGMSGAWQTTATKHTALALSYNNSGLIITRDIKHVYFNDPRHFGTVKFIREEDEHLRKLSTLGPCILSDNVTPELFAKRLLHKTNRNICEALMDQSALSGIGNYLRAEILFDSRISPWRNVTQITAKEYEVLCASTARIAKKSYESHGATIKTYRTLDDHEGEMQFAFKIYSMKTCDQDHLIQRAQDATGRTVHWCPICQA